MESLRIGLVAPPWVPVPPPQYGGTEVVVDELARGLAAAGHDVVLYTTGDSTCPVPRRWTHPRALGIDGSAEAELLHVEDAYRALVGHVDVIHDHTLFGPWRLLSRSCPTPVVTTHHGPFSEEMVRLWAPISRRIPLIAISRSQAAAGTAAHVEVSAVIHHGLDVGRYPFGDGHGGYVAFLGRINPDKGPASAIAAARAAGVPIRIAAKMWEQTEVRYFAEVIEPLLRADAVYVGELGGRDKLEFLAGAQALLNPLRWPEPFGLAMIEAMACGTPVLAFPSGAAPEIVRHGLNGFLCNDEAEMADAIVHARSLDRQRCRSSVVDRFSVERMVADHLRLYRNAIADWPSRLPHVTSAGVPAPSVPF